MKNKFKSFFNNDNKKYVLGLKIRQCIQQIIYKQKFQQFGSNSVIYAPDRILGGKHILIGKNVSILHHARIEALTEYNGKTYRPTIYIGDNVSIGQDVHMTCANKIEIEEGTTITGRVMITDIKHVTSDTSKSTLKQDIITCPTHIGKNCLLGINVCIMPGVTLGDGCVVGANAVVTKSVPAGKIIAGVPAKIIGENKL